MAYKPPFQMTDTLSTLTIEIAELLGAISFNEHFTKNPTLHRKLRVKTIHSSLLIEGNSLDEQTVSAILEGKHVVGKAQDILEVQNAQKAYALLPTLNPYSEKDLLKAHGEMMYELTPHPGCFRSQNAGVFSNGSLVHAGTPAKYVSSVMADLFAWLKGTSLHPLISASIFHYEFEFIHPFLDGNGRIGRLWHTLLLSKWRPVLAYLPVETLIMQTQQDYYRAFVASQNKGSANPFVEYMLTALKHTLEPFATKKPERALQAQEILAYFDKNPSGTVKELTENLQCSLRTAERIVKKLKADGALRRIGSARAGVWKVQE